MILTLALIAVLALSRAAEATELAGDTSTEAATATVDDAVDETTATIEDTTATIEDTVEDTAATVEDEAATIEETDAADAAGAASEAVDATAEPTVPDDSAAPAESTAPDEVVGTDDAGGSVSDGNETVRPPASAATAEDGDVTAQGTAPGNSGRARTSGHDTVDELVDLGNELEAPTVLGERIATPARASAAVAQDSRERPSVAARLALTGAGVLAGLAAGFGLIALGGAASVRPRPA